MEPPVKDDRPINEMIQAAQVRLLRDPTYAHPYFWAPFILMGNWL